MKRVKIFRGLPGSGKSTMAKEHAYGEERYAIVSADNYFMVDGEYRFDPTRIGEAHTACMRAFLDALKLDTPLVIVDNTNTTIAEVTPYRLVALAMGYEVEIIRVECHPEICAKRNTHGVPAATIEKMAARFEPIPAFLGGEQTVQGY